MVPESVAGVVVLVVLILPGLAFELLRQARRAGRDDSAFLEISRVLVAGLSLGAMTLTLLAGVSLVGPNSIVSLRGLFTERQWVADHLLVSGWTAGAYGVLSVTVAAMTASLLPGTNTEARLHPESGWVTVFDRLPRLMQEQLALPALPTVRLSVRLLDGTLYLGDRAEFSMNAELADRELALGGAIYCEMPGQPGRLLDGWHRVALRADRISDIAVQYVPGPNPAPAPAHPSRIAELLRTRAARLLGLPSDAPWHNVVEAPVVRSVSARRMLFAELGLLLCVAALSRIG